MKQPLLGKKIVVTGWTGLIGSALAPVLEKSGARVLTARTPEEISEAFDGVIHLAGMADFSACEANPDAAFDSNVKLTERWLEKCRVSGSGFFVFASTGQVYGSQLNAPANESTPLIARNIYLGTKLASEAILTAYAGSYGIRAVALRLSNVYSERSRPNSVIGNLMSQIRESGRAQMRELGPVRDFIHIDDVTSAIVGVVERIEHLNFPVYNLGTGKATSIRELAGVACRLGGIDPSAGIKGEEGRPSWNALDSSRLQNEIHWKPEVSLEEGLRKTFYV